MLRGHHHVGPADATHVPQPGQEALVVNLAGHGSGNEPDLNPPLTQAPAKVVVLVPVGHEPLIEAPEAQEQPTTDGGVPEGPVIESQPVPRRREAPQAVLIVAAIMRRGTMPGQGGNVCDLGRHACF